MTKITDVQQSKINIVKAILISSLSRMDTLEDQTDTTSFKKIANQIEDNLMDGIRELWELQRKEKEIEVVGKSTVSLVKGIWLCLILILSLNVNAQYVGVGVINKGICAVTGFTANKINVQAALTFPITNLQNDNTVSLSAGYELNLTNDDKDNYTLTPSIGAALVKSRTWDIKDVMTVHSNIKPILGVEIGKDAFMGRVFIQANYINSMYYGMGMKVFFNR